MSPDLDPAPVSSPAPVRRRRARERTAHLEIGAVIGRTFSIYVRHLPILLVLAAVLFTPTLLVHLGATEEAFGSWRSYDSSPLGERLDFWDFLGDASGPGARILEGATPWVLQFLITYAVFQALRSQRPRYDRSVAVGLRRSLPALGAALLTTIVAYLPVLAAVFLGVAARSPGLVVLLGLAAIVFLVIAHCTYFVSVQAAVVEGVNPLRALSRSAGLTRGARGSLFALLLLVGGLALIAGAVVQYGTSFDEPSSVEEARRGVFWSTGATVLFAPLMAVMSAVVYHDLRRSKEGVGVEELVRVFE